MADWIPLLGVVATAALYWRGARVRRPDGRPAIPTRTAWAFAGGLVTTAIALAPPVHDAAERTFAAHMVQHVLLIAIAPPLLVLGEPGRAFVLSAPAAWRQSLRHHRLRPPGTWLMWMSMALVVQATVMWAWHAPVLYDAALHHEWLHALEHASLLGTAVWAWWGLLRTRRSRRGAGALALFVGAFPGTALGAALLLAPRPWYPSYVHQSLDAALADQQLAAVVMWCVTGIAYVVGAAVLFATWLAEADRRERAGGKYAY